MVDGVNHVCRVPCLLAFAVHIHVEMDVLHVASQFFLGDELTQCGTAVKSLATFPRHAFIPQFLLEVTCREVDADGQFVVVAMGKAFADVLANMGYLHHNLGLIVETGCKVWHKEGLAWLDDARIELGEQDRLCV